MMAQKRLDELLKEDQEPFQLKSYIADRRTKLRPSSRTHLHNPKPIPNFPGKFCLFSFQGSPDLRKSPLASPAGKSPCRSPIFLHIPARTAALLLEAALRIQKHSKATHTPKTHGFGLFGSILKRLTNRGRKKEIESAKVYSSVGRKSRISDQRDKSGRYSGNVSTRSSAIWSETNEEKSQETSTSGQSDQDSSEIFASKDIHSIGDYGYCESPFRFVLQRNPSGHRTPEFLSPAASPCRTKTEEKDKYDVESLNKLLDGGAREEEEQCSPVSVLDAPFQDDEEGNGDDEEEEDDDSSYAIVQKAKQQLLKKLQRFEKLAGLDPIELEKRMVEDCQEDDGIKVDFHEDGEIPKHMRLLVSDLIAEEEKLREEDEEEVTKRVVKRVELWEDVEANTIDMMVEQDFRREFGEWIRNQQQVKDTAAELELAIFGLLVQELWT